MNFNISIVWGTNYRCLKCPSLRQLTFSTFTCGKYKNSDSQNSVTLHHMRQKILVLIRTPVCLTCWLSQTMGHIFILPFSFGVMTGVDNSTCNAPWPGTDEAFLEREGMIWIYSFKEKHPQWKKGISCLALWVETL